MIRVLDNFWAIEVECPLRIRTHSIQVLFVLFYWVLVA